MADRRDTECVVVASLIVFRIAFCIIILHISYFFNTENLCYACKSWLTYFSLLSGNGNHLAACRRSMGLDFSQYSVLHRVRQGSNNRWCMRGLWSVIREHHYHNRLVIVCELTGLIGKGNVMRVAALVKGAPGWRLYNATSNLLPLRF